MKKIFSILAVLVLLLMAPMVFALENGQGIRNGQVTLYSQATGTTAAVTTSVYTFDQVMKYGACDLISGLSATTANVTLVVKGNQGSSATLFDSTAYLITSTTLASSLTVTGMKTIPFASGVAAPFRTIQATITAPTTTQVITLNCSVIQ